MADEETEDQELDEAPPSGGGNKLMVVMALMNLIAVGGIGAFLIMNQNNQAAAAQGSAAPVAAATGAVQGPLVPLDPLVVNLNVVGATRYLKVSAQVELHDGAAVEEFTPNLVPLRHRLLIELSGLTVEDTQGAEKKLKLQDELRDKINEMLGAGTITRIMFTEFVVQ